MLWLIIGCAVLTVVGIVVAYWNTGRYDSSVDWVLVGILVALICGMGFLVTLLPTVAVRHKQASGVRQYEAFVKSLGRMRENGREIESVAIQQKIVEFNMEIASARYWNSGFTDIMVLDEFAELEPIE